MKFLRETFLVGLASVVLLVAPGSAWADGPEASADPPAFDFGTANTAGDVARGITIAVLSTGTVDLEIEDISLVGPNPEPFSIDPGFGCESPVPPGSSCSIHVSFFPGGEPGFKHADIAVTTNASPEPLLIALSGNVERTTLTIAPASHDFGTVQSGSTEHPTHTFTITSTGSVPFNPGAPRIATSNVLPLSISLQHPFSVASADCDRVLQPGESCSATVAFTPEPGASGPQSAFMVIGPGQIPASAVLTGDVESAVAPGFSKVDVSLKLRKRLRARHIVVVTRLKNEGRNPARSVTLRLKGTRSLIKPSKVARIARIAAGQVVSKRFRMKIRPAAKRGRRATIRAIVSVSGQRASVAHRTIRIR